MDLGGPKKRSRKRRRVEKARRNKADDKKNKDENSSRIERSVLDAVEGSESVDIPSPSGPGHWDSAWKRVAKQYWPQKPSCPASPVQAHVWPILCSQDAWNLICLSPTGSGKTLAYGLPLVLYSKDKPGGTTEPAAAAAVAAAASHTSLILLPTRELVQQVGREILRVSKAVGGPSVVVVQTVHGGVDREQHLRNLQNNSQQPNTHFIIVATTGRLVDLLERSSEKQANRFSWIPALDTVILDEADRLASNNDLQSQVDTILTKFLIPPFKLALFSATWPDKVTAKWKDWIHRASQSSQTRRPCAVIKVNPVRLHESNTADESSPPDQQSTELTEKEDQAQDALEPAEEEESDPTNCTKKFKQEWSQIPSNITQTLHVCAEHKKPRKLLATLQIAKKKTQEQHQQRHVSLGIVFFSKIKTIQHMTKFLEKEGIANVELHGQMSQSSRERHVQKFRCGQVPLLLATDVAARGLDMSGIRFVINYDFPGNLEHYVHRCGRAGRDGKPATVYSFFTRNLQPLASDTMAILQNNGQWVDPNLLALVEEGKDANNNKNKKRRQKEKSQRYRNENLDSEEEQNSADEFPSLALDRIVLKRASHVSDASNSEDDKSNSED